MFKFNYYNCVIDLNFYTYKNFIKILFFLKKKSIRFYVYYFYINKFIYIISIIIFINKLNEGLIMDLPLKMLIGFILAFILHELTHLIVILYYKIPIKSIVLTKWSAFGFLVDNEKYINNKKILILLHFSPLVWCSFYIINPNEPYFLMLALFNITGGIGDMYYFVRIILLSPEKRIEWAEKSDEKILKSIIWQKQLSK